MTPKRDQGIQHEPHLSPGSPLPDPSEHAAEEILANAARNATEADQVEHTVWDEPTLSGSVVSEPPVDEPTYSRWLAKKIGETSARKSWLVTVAIVLASGPWGVIGALGESLITGYSAGGISALAVVCIVGPVTEEVMKIAIALWVVEKRPYLFKSIPQILLCAVAGGLAFAWIENLIYLNIYIPNAKNGLAIWRWTVCTGLHTTCSLVAGVGLARIWDNAIRNVHRPILGLGMPWFFTAMAGHGLYNFSVFVAESAGWLKF